MTDEECREFVSKFADETPLEPEHLRAALNANLIFVNDGKWALTEFGRSFLPLPPGDSASCPDDDSYWPGHPNRTDIEREQGTLNQRARDVLDAIKVGGVGVAGGVSAKDNQVGGDHYRKLGAYQPWEVLAKWMTPEELRGYMKGTVIAYLAREQDKGGDTDIAKAMHTMQLWQEVREDK